MMGTERRRLAIASLLSSFFFLAAARFGCASAASAAAEIPVGAARVDVTPQFPIRLCGYAARDAEATSAAQPLYARALAIGGDAELAVIVAVDNCAVPASITDELARRLAKRGLSPERFTLSVTHTHTGPWLAGSIECMFRPPVPDRPVRRLRQYHH